MTDLFEEKAKDWDVNDRVLALSRGVGAALLANVEFKPDMSVMDFGAGTGLLASHVAPRVAQITAVDISESMLEKLTAKTELQGKVKPLCRDILSDPVGERYDVIISAMAMHHIEDTDRLLRTFAFHLKPGGRVALADLDKEDGTFHPADVQGVFHHGFERNPLQQKLEAAGFCDVDFVTAHTVRGEEKDYPVFLATASLK
ncbi:MAG: class I SAM-dependent methyltransferase [Gammaproteobacteria bacterium]|nr:class I SAM-dependent methyltransferase [Gammaproteobacteria bacterium]